ncbi:hypothetical protein FIV23_14025 [Lactiplantibacillus plantarum]|nr:hypothetical protein [Lactiplantibacillus plantarum]
MTTLRWMVFHIPATITHHARHYILKLSSNNIFDDLYWSIMKQIQCLT